MINLVHLMASLLVHAPVSCPASTHYCVFRVIRKSSQWSTPERQDMIAKLQPPWQLDADTSVPDAD